MKKYSKLALVLIALVSSVFFLFYKLRYDRLYNVMQVLEVFGSPASSAAGRCIDVSTIPIIGVAPTWRFFANHLYVYSAHCTAVAGGRGSCQSVKIVSIATKAIDSENHVCKLWYEGSDAPIQGTLTIQQEEEEASAFPVTISCDAKYAEHIPYAISLHHINGEWSDIIPVAPVPLNKQRSSLGICLFPASPSTSLVDQTASLLQSILFHSLLGVQNLLVYSASVPHSVLGVAQRLQADYKTQIEFRPWNLPSAVKGISSTQLEKLIALDCYLHNQYSENYILLNQTHLLMLKSATNISQVLLTSNLAVGPNPLQVRKFCSEYPDEKSSSIMSRKIGMLQSTYYNRKLSTAAAAGVPVELVHTGPSLTQQQTHIKTEILVNDYGACDQYDFSEHDKTAIHDKSALKFTDSMLNAYKMYVL